MIQSLFTITNIHKKLVYGLAGAVLVAVGMYGYFLNETVHNVVERRHLEERITEMQTEVSNLEIAYITARNEIDRERATARGFTPARDARFVRLDQAPALSAR